MRMIISRAHARIKNSTHDERFAFKNHVLDAGYIICGICFATVGLKGFLLPNGFLDGGVTGISLLVSHMTGMKLSVLIAVINLPFIYLGAIQISKQFAIKTLIAIIGLAVIVHFYNLPHLTDDKLLISVFGGFLLGAGIGLCIRGGCVIDGTEVLAVFVSRRTFLTVGDFVGLFNVILFGTAIFLTNLETGLYSMLTYIAASKTVDFVITGIEEYVGVTIVSDKSEQIKSCMIDKLGMPVTIYKGEGGFGKNGMIEGHKSIIFTVITRLEVQKLKTEVSRIDRYAFVVQHTVNDTLGGLVKKRSLEE